MTWWQWLLAILGVLIAPSALYVAVLVIPPLAVDRYRRRRTPPKHP